MGHYDDEQGQNPEPDSEQEPEQGPGQAQEEEGELANWDPEAPPELTDEQLARQRQIGLLKGVAVALLLVAMVASIARAVTRDKKPDMIITNDHATGMVDLSSEAVKTVGKLEGPYVLVDVPGPCTARLGYLGHPSEIFRLIGLSSGDGWTESEIAALPEIQRKRREECLAAINVMRRDAIRDACGPGRLWIIRFPKPGPGQLAPIFLFKPVSDATGTTAPNGKAALINAMLLRDGKASLQADEPQPFKDPWMWECQLAALIHARRENADNANTVWNPRYGLKLPLSPKMEKRMEELKTYVQ